MRGGRFAVVVMTLTLVVTTAVPIGRGSVALAAECTPKVGPGIPPPASVPSGIPGFHAHWYGQSGYPTLCPGQTSRAVVAFYNSGSLGWFGPLLGPQSLAFLGTSNPTPGQDQTSILGGDSTHGSPQTRWPVHNRPAVQPAPYVGPGQVAWFQFTVKAPPVPGTYRLYIRPLIEGVVWMEDFGVFWQVTVIPTTTAPQRVTVQSFDPVADFFSDGTTRFNYDRNDSFEFADGTLVYEEFEALLGSRSGVVIDVRYESSPAEQSTFNIVDAPPIGPPSITTEIGSYDRGATKNDIRVDIIPPASAGAQSPSYNLQRATVAAGTATCTMTSGSYEFNPTTWAQGISGSFFDLNVPAGTYCYRANASASAFGFSAPVTMPASPAPAPGAPAPISLDARAFRPQGAPAATDTFRAGDRLKIAFDGTMALCDDAVVRLRDADGTVAEFSRAALNIDCSRNRSAEVVGTAIWPEFSVITLTIAADPTILTPGSQPGLHLPATVTSATGIRSDAGLAWDLGRSVDIVFGDPD